MSNADTVRHSRDGRSIAFELTKAGSLDKDNPQVIVEQARSIQRAAPNGTTFVLAADDDGVLHAYVVFPARSRTQHDNLAFQVGTALAARAKRAEAPDLSTVRAVAQMAVRTAYPLSGNAVQAGADFSLMIRSLAGALMRGEWVAISVREPSSGERKRHLQWRQVGHRQQTHHSLGAGAKIMSCYAGGENHGRASYLVEQVANTMPGFDLMVRGERVRMAPAIAGPVACSAVAAGAGVALSALPAYLPEFAWLASVQPWWLWGVGAGVAVSGTAVLRRRGLIPSAASRRASLLSAGLVPPPGVRVRRPRPPHGERTRMKRLESGETIPVTEPAFDGDYPLAGTAAMVGGHLPLGLVAPHADARFGDRAASDRLAPAALREAIGPVVVTDSEGDVHLSAEDAWAGTFVTGRAGSGKTRLLIAIWAWYCMELARPAAQRAPGFPDRVSMIAFDTKEDGEAAAAYTRWAEAFGMPVHRFDVADPDASHGIAFFAPPGGRRTCSDYALEVVDALIYAYGQDAIGNRSKPSLIGAFAGASLLSVRPDLVQLVPGAEPGRSPFFYANILIGNRDDELAKQLAAVIAQAATALPSRDADPDLVEVAERLEPLYGPGVTPAARRNLFDAPRSKVSPLLDLDRWWSRPQQQTWDQLLEEGTPVVLNFGLDAAGNRLSEGASSQMGALAMYALYMAVKRTCAGWQAQGRRFAPFADEVKHLAAHSSDVLAWFRNDARSFGADPKFATQFPEQLEEQLRKTMNGYGTRVMFAQDDETVIRQLVQNLSTDGSTWRPEDISTLPRYHAIVKTTRNQTSVPAFVGVVPDFEAMTPEEFTARADGGEAPVPSAAPAASPSSLGADARSVAERQAAERRARMQQAVDAARAAEGAPTDG